VLGLEIELLGLPVVNGVFPVVHVHGPAQLVVQVLHQRGNGVDVANFSACGSSAVAMGGCLSCAFVLSLRVALMLCSVQFHPRDELRPHAHWGLHLAQVAVFQVLFDLGAASASVGCAIWHWRGVSGSQ
jgi:hypothetical protein